MMMKQNQLPEIICFITYIIFTIFIAFFHEPWLDEFQSWEISKESIYNILFTIPHFEIHPPLWHLVLKCFSFFNINPEAGLSIANFIFIYPAVWLLIFQSPFNRIIRLTLPFTYFIFYQYAIISRPYSIFILGIFLAALFYKERNIKPFKFISALILVSFSSAYGMFFTAGIAIVWFIEMVKNTNLRKLKSDKRIFSLFILFFILLLTAVIIFPDKNIAHQEPFSANKSFRFLYAFFIFPLDTLITNICCSLQQFNKINLLWCLLTIFLYLLFYKILKFYKARLLFFIPFLIFLIVAFSLHIDVHHIGLLTLFYIFVFWCIFNEKQFLLSKNLKKFYSILLFITIGIQIYWSISACISDYKYDYWISRKAANYIKKYNLDKYLILPNFTSKNLQLDPVYINPYFNKNIFYSFNIHNPDKNYVIWERLSKEKNEEIRNKIKSFGLPEIIFSIPMDLQAFFSEQEAQGTYYKMLNFIDAKQVFKNKLIHISLVIYARDDIYNELKLKYPDIDNEN